MKPKNDKPDHEPHVVWIRCEWQFWVLNTIAMLFPLAFILLAAIEFTDLRLISGVAIGLWLGMVYNCLWAWISRKNNETK
jgi:hypothetical protein